jgi:hypothetical protein
VHTEAGLSTGDLEEADVKRAEFSGRRNHCLGFR